MEKRGTNMVTEYNLVTDPRGDLDHAPDLLVILKGACSLLVILPIVLLGYAMFLIYNGWQ